MTKTKLTRWPERARMRIEERFTADEARPRVRAFEAGWNDGWRRNGSAGQASKWFELALIEHPLEPAAVVASLTKMIEDNIKERPRYYTRRHLDDLLAIVSEEAGIESQFIADRAN